MKEQAQLYIKGLIILSFFLFSCENDTENNSEIVEVPVFPLHYTTDSIFLYHPTCKDEHSDECTTISYEKVKVYTATDSVLKGITDTINSVYLTMISDNVSEKRFTNIDTLKTLFFNSWTRYKNEVSGHVPFHWKIIVKGSGNSVLDSLFCYSVTSYSFTGGAHGNAYKKYLTFDVASQELINPIAGLNHAHFLQLAEKYFRKKVNISPDASLSKEGFFFDNGKFHLSHEIGINKKGYVLYYNDYEIRPHAEGPLELVIPFEAFNETR